MKASRSLSDELPVLLDNGMMILSGQDGPAEGLPLSVQTLKYDHDHMEYYEKTNFRYKR